LVTTLVLIAILAAWRIVGGLNGQLDHMRGGAPATDHEPRRERFHADQWDTATDAEKAEAREFRRSVYGEEPECD